MIQFNLLPDVKLALIKARRTEHLAMSIATVVIVASAALLLLMFSMVDVIQKKSLDDVNSDIAKYSTTIKNTPSLNQILTVQNQLNALPALESQKPVVTRLAGYIAQVTPQQVNLSELQVGFVANTLEFTGTANALSTVDQFVDTLKFTTFTPPSSTAKESAFSNVVLTSFSRTATTANFDITMDFNPVIFNVADNITQLNVPDETSTRSVLDQPNIPLFTGSTTPNIGGQ